MTEESTGSAASSQQNYVFIDGPSLDRELGEVLGRRPDPNTRPDWTRLQPFVQRICGGGTYEATFVIWAPGQSSFIDFLRFNGFETAFGERDVPGQSCADKIRRAIETQDRKSEFDPDRSWNLVVGTHNEHLIRDLPEIAPSAAAIHVFGFEDHFTEDPDLDALEHFHIHDIEDDGELFRSPLPRNNDDFIPGAPPPPTYGDRRVRDYDQPGGPDGDRMATPPEFTPIEAEGPMRDMYLIIDGRSIENELGEIIGGKPNPSTRPNWQTVLRYARSQSRAEDGQVKALFVHIAPGHPGFTRAIQDIGYRSQAVQRDPDQLFRPVVEEYICQLLGTRGLRGEAPGEPPPDIMVVGHGRALLAALQDIPELGQRVCALGFPERMPSRDMYHRVEQLDLEIDARAFSISLPRVTGVNVDSFDAEDELSKLF